MDQKTTSDIWIKTQESDEFAQHRKRYRSFAFPMAVGFLVWYFTFIMLTTFARDFVSIFLFGYINIAFVLALLQFVTTFFIAWLYDRYSTKNLDGPAEELKNKVESELYS
ncbi:MAG TPA: DUF485 domain-containing protein [Pontimonas sp.]|nr:DUF485 domain-containing protein [Pontimonas sp.]